MNTKMITLPVLKWVCGTWRTFVSKRGAALAYKE